MLFSCKVGYERLTYQRRAYVGNEIQIHGYYYCFDHVSVYEKPLVEPETRIVSRIYFFYSNGVMLYLNTYLSEFDELEAYFKDTNEMSQLKTVPYGWGIYLVEGNQIKIETWVSSVGGKHPNFTYNVNILNDTTLIELNGDNTFHFKKFSPKPDSVNRFVN